MALLALLDWLFGPPLAIEILEFLEDGQWKTTREIRDAVGPRIYAHLLIMEEEGRTVRRKTYNRFSVNGVWYERHAYQITGIGRATLQTHRAERRKIR